MRTAPRKVLKARSEGRARIRRPVGLIRPDFHNIGTNVFIPKPYGHPEAGWRLDRESKLDRLPDACIAQWVPDSPGSTRPNFTVFYLNISLAFTFFIA